MVVFHADAQLINGFTNSRQQGAHVRFEEPANGANTETVRLGKLAGINDKTAVAEPMIKIVERKSWIVGIMECSDDIALEVRRKISPETHLFHALEQ